MRNPILFPAILLAILPSGAFASANRDTWLKDLRLEMSQSSCNASAYFRRCFTETTGECVAASERAFDTCAARYKKNMPKDLSEKEFNDWRAKMKMCEGASLAIALEDAKKAKEDLISCGAKSDAIAQDQPILADQYLEQMAISLPQDLCFEGMPHRTCYSVSEAECRKEITKAVDQCKPGLKNEFPSKISLSENREWDMVVLECVAPIFDKDLSAKRTNKEEFCKTAISSLREKKSKSRKK